MKRIATLLVALAIITAGPARPAGGPNRPVNDTTHAPSR